MLILLVLMAGLLSIPLIYISMPNPIRFRLPVPIGQEREADVIADAVRRSPLD
jgi:hypothetical protein